MNLLTEDAALICPHQGKVRVQPSQSLVTIHARKVLVETDPEEKAISGCINVAPGIKPCTLTLKVRQGYSELLRIHGRRVCLDTVNGFTDGTPPGSVPYKVKEPGQDLVKEAP